MGLKPDTLHNASLSVCLGGTGATGFVARLPPHGLLGASRVLQTSNGKMLSHDSDLMWRDTPNAWHQQIARIVDHRFSTFNELVVFARNAKKAGVSVIMLVEIQKTAACPGPWYNGLQLCEHINGSFPAPDGSLEQWQAMLREIAPVRLMWWTNMVYWSVQGPVWAQAAADRTSDVGRWFSWTTEDCSGVAGCPGRPVSVPGVGLAQRE